MSKKKKKEILSLSLPSEYQKKIKLAAAQKTDRNVSQLIREMMDKYLCLEDDVIPVLLKIPIELKSDPEGLEKWMKRRMEIIIQHLLK